MNKFCSRHSWHHLVSCVTQLPQLFACQWSKIYSCGHVPNDCGHCQSLMRGHNIWFTRLASFIEHALYATHRITCTINAVTTTNVVNVIRKSCFQLWMYIGGYTLQREDNISAYSTIKDKTRWEPITVLVVSKKSQLLDKWSVQLIYS